MRKHAKTDKTQAIPVTLTHEALQLVTGGINGGLNRDIIRRKA